MANLLPRAEAPFPGLSGVERTRVDTRARFLSGAPWPSMRAASAAMAHALASELDELEEAPSLPIAQSLLAELDAGRAAFHAGAGRKGDDQGTLRALLFRPGRSLRSGEAEAASRGFFDVADRPPPILWLEAIARSRAAGSAEVEVGILCGVPEAVLDAAEAGVRVCASGALTWVGDPEARFVDALPTWIGQSTRTG